MNLLVTIDAELTDLERAAKNLRSAMTPEVETHRAAELLLYLAEVNEVLGDAVERLSVRRGIAQDATESREASESAVCTGRTRQTAFLTPLDPSGL